MKRRAQLILIPLILLMVFSLAAPAVFAQTAPAATGAAAPTVNTDTSNVSLWGLSIPDVVNSLLANLVNTVLSATAFLVGIAASLLNVSIVLTLHIKDFVTATPAIYTIWQTIRDVTGIFFIFFLLYAAIKIILQVDTSYGSLIKNIVVAGILINFSFFITSVLIDASNVVSQAIYNAMIPGASITITKDTKLTDLAAQASGYNQSTGQTAGGSGGISDVFLNSLKIQSVYDTQGNRVGTAVGQPFKIVLIGIVGVIIMIVAALSFVLAAAAFVARLVILLFLLAFSPLWFAGSVIPQLKEYTGKFTGHLKSQLIFMPVYLLLMYAALSVLNNSNIMGAANAMISGAGNNTNWAFSYIVLAINFVMVIFMLNLPLAVGLSMGGAASDWLGKATKKFSAANVWKTVGSWTGRNTVGWAATRTNDSRIMRQLYGSNPNLGLAVSKGLSNVGSAGFGGKKGGYEADLKARKKAIEGLHKRVGTIDESAYATEQERAEARDQAKEYQRTFRETLPRRSVLTGMLKLRSNRQSALSLKDEAELDDNKKRQKFVAEQIEKLEARGSTTDRSNAELAALKNENIQLLGAIKRGTGKKKQKETLELAKALGDTAKEEGGGEGEKKEEKTEEKKT